MVSTISKFPLLLKRLLGNWFRFDWLPNTGCKCTSVDFLQSTGTEFKTWVSPFLWHESLYTRCPGQKYTHVLFNSFLYLTSHFQKWDIIGLMKKMLRMTIYANIGHFFTKKTRPKEWWCFALNVLSGYAYNGLDGLCITGMTVYEIPCLACKQDGARGLGELHRAV